MIPRTATGQNTSTDRNKPLSLCELLFEGSPNKDCIADGKTSLTYGQLRDQIQFFSHQIPSTDRLNRDAVFIDSTSSVDFIAALFAASEAGWVPIPIDPSTTYSSIDKIANQCSISRRIKIKTDKTIQIDELPTHSHLAPEQSFRPSDLSLGMLTSGTSGWPKIVCLSTSNLVHSFNAISNYLDYRSQSSAAVVLPLHYSYALLSQVLCMLNIGGRIRLFSPAETRNPIKLARAIDTDALETFCGVPATYQAFRTIYRMKPFSMPKVKLICSAGAAMDRSMYGEMKSMFPSASVVNNYGMTEAAPRISYIRDDDEDFFEPTCGRPIPGVDVCVLDPESHKRVEDGQLGVLAVKGGNITSGYLNAVEETSKAFSRDGWLISGDGAYISNGLIYLQGRLDDLFNVCGEKVSPSEIERALMNHPRITRAAVRGFNDDQRGMVPVAFVELGDLEPISRKDILITIRPFLSDIKIPSRIFQVSSFPATKNGKIKRRNLSMKDDERIIRELK